VVDDADAVQPADFTYSLKQLDEVHSITVDADRHPALKPDRNQPRLIRRLLWERYELEHIILSGLREVFYGRPLR